MRFCVSLVLEPLVVVVQHEPALIDAPFPIGFSLRHMVAIELADTPILPADRPCRGVDGVKLDRFVALRVGEAQTVDNSAAFVCLVDEVRQKFILLRLDVLYREPADSDVRIIARVAPEPLEPSRPVPDRDGLDSGFPLKPPPNVEHSIKTDDFVDVQLEVLLHSVLVDELRVSADVLVPVDALSAAEKRERSGVQKKTLSIHQERNLPRCNRIKALEDELALRELSREFLENPGRREMDFHGLNHSPQCGQRTSPSWFSSAVSVFSSACSSSAGSASLKKLSRSASE